MKVIKTISLILTSIMLSVAHASAPTTYLSCAISLNESIEKALNKKLPHETEIFLMIETDVFKKKAKGTVPVSLIVSQVTAMHFNDTVLGKQKLSYKVENKEMQFSDKNAFSLKIKFLKDLTRKEMLSEMITEISATRNYISHHRASVTLSNLKIFENVPMLHVKDQKSLCHFISTKEKYEDSDSPETIRN